MNTILAPDLETLARPSRVPSTTPAAQRDVTTRREGAASIELVVRLPDPWREPRVGGGRTEAAFRIVRYLGPLPGRTMLGEYGLDLLVDGPIRAVATRATIEVPTGITTHLALSCVLDQIRALFDAARSWAPGALYRLSIRTTRLGAAHLVEIEGSPDLEGRAFLPRELLERGAGEGPIPDAERPAAFGAAFSSSANPARVETSIRMSGAWTIRVRIESDSGRA